MACSSVMAMPVIFAPAQCHHPRLSLARLTVYTLSRTMIAWMISGIRDKMTHSAAGVKNKRIKKKRIDTEWTVAHTLYMTSWSTAFAKELEARCKTIEEAIKSLKKAHILASASQVSYWRRGMSMPHLRTRLLIQKWSKGRVQA